MEPRFSASRSRGATAGFLSGLIGSLPQVHELAEQAGIELPGALGKVADSQKGPNAKPSKPADPA